MASTNTTKTLDLPRLHFSPSLNLALIIIPIVTGSISLICSFLLIYRIVSHRARLFQRVKERLILGLSIMDCIFSMASLLSTFAGPRALYQTNLFDHFLLFGNDSTCQLQGFLYQLGSFAPLYNASLCLYFYLNICRNVQDKDLLTRLNREPLWHLCIWAWAFISASMAVGSDFVFFGGYNGCYIKNINDERCEFLPELRDCRVEEFDATVWVAALTLPPHILSITTIIITLLLIYSKVLQIEGNSQKWKDPSDLFNKNVAAKSRDGQSGSFGNLPSSHGCEDDGVIEKMEPVGLNSSCDAGGEMERRSPDCEESKVSEQQGDEFVGDPSQYGNAQNSQDGEEIDIFMVAPTYSTPTRDAQQNVDDGFRSESSLSHNIAVVLRIDDEDISQQDFVCGLSSRRNDELANLSSIGSLKFPKLSSFSSFSFALPRGRMSRRVYETGIQYVLGYLVTYLPLLVRLFLPRAPGGFLVLVSITFPLQGFWNFVFYIRGRMRVLRADHERQKRQRQMGSKDADLDAEGPAEDSLQIHKLLFAAIFR